MVSASQVDLDGAQGDSQRPASRTHSTDLVSRPQSSTEKLNKGWRKIIRNFTPSWFAVTMGTGIVSILLHNLPYNASWLNYISICFFALNVALFAIFTVISIIRYTFWPEIWGVMIRHPSQSLFLGTFPMGLATLINMFVFVCVPNWGPGAVQFAWAMFWVDSAISISIAVYLPFVIMSLHKSNLASMTAAWLLPVVSTIVAAGTGSIVAEVLPNPQHALWTLIASYVLWGTGVPLAMSILVIYFQRLALHHLPPREVIVSVFLPLGPLGQGGFAIMQLGKVALQVFPETGTLLGNSSGETLYSIGFLAAIIMWGYGVLWLFLALASISRSRFPFNMGWWGFTFPTGVFAVATVTLGKELPSKFFNVLGTILSAAVVLLWVVVALGTLRKAVTGEIFFAPCLGDLRKNEPAEMGESV